MHDGEFKATFIISGLEKRKEDPRVTLSAEIKELRVRYNKCNN